jgi:hypothetical protein
VAFLINQLLNAEKPLVTPNREREFFVDNLVVRIHFIIEMILVDRPCAMGEAPRPEPYTLHPKQ